MNELTIINQEGKLLVDSREVAEMVGKRHDHLIRDIQVYIKTLDLNPKLGSANFFIESTYKNQNNQTYPCYLLTKKGCDMVANKMTGEKGILFTAEYVTKFEEMEKQINIQSLNTSELSPELQMFKQIFDTVAKQQLENKELKKNVEETKAQIQETKEEMQGIRDIVSLSPNAWRKDTTNLINQIARKLGGIEHIKDVREESYKQLNESFGVNIQQRLKNKQKNMALEGVSKTKINNTNCLDVIADDKKLINGYVAIIGKMAIKNGI